MTAQQEPAPRKQGPLTPSARGDALGFIYQVGGQVVGIALSIGALTLTLRYLGPDRYGAVTAVVAFLGLWQCFTDFGVSATIVQRAARAPRQLDDDVRASFGLSLAYCGVLAAVAAGCCELLYRGRYSDIGLGIVAVAVGLAATALASSWQPLFQRASRYLPLAIGDLAARVAALVLVLIAVKEDWGTNGVLVALGAGPIARLVVLAVAARQMGAGRPLFAPRHWWALVVAAVPIGATQIVSLFYYRADAVLLSLLAGAAEVGSYGLALRLLAPVVFLPTLILTGGIARLSQAFATDVAAFRALLLKLFRYVLILSVAMAALGVPVAGALVHLVGGPQYAPAIGAVRLVFVATGLIFLNAVWSVGLTGASQQRLLLRLSMLGLVINVTLNLVLIPFFGAEGAASALLLSELASAAISYLALRRTTGFSLAGPRWTSLALAAVAGFAVVAVAPGFWAIPAAVVGLLAYGGLLLWLRFVTLDEFLKIMRRA